MKNAQSLHNFLTARYGAIGIVYAVLVFVTISIALSSFAFADASRARGGQSAGEDRRTAALTNVLGILENVAPGQAQSPEAVANAPANDNTEPPAPDANVNSNGSGSNGGAVSGNGGAGGNAGAGGLVRSGSVVSNAQSVNVINTTIVRIGR